MVNNRPGVSEKTVVGYFDSMSKWGEWGAEDQLGALNLITPQKVLSATRLVTGGLRVPLGRSLEFAPKPTKPEALISPTHFMQKSGEAAPDDEMGSAVDWAGLPLHGLYVTHLDAPSHIFWKGRMFNGHPSHRVTTDRGALSGSVDLAHEGIVTRGVLLDIPPARGLEWLENGDGVSGDDMLAAEVAAGVTIERGDLLFVRTGYGKRRPSDDPSFPGVTVDCLPFIHERRPAVLATDSGTDAFPSGFPSMEAPVHAVCMVAMGMWIIDNCDLEALSDTCRSLNRWHFLVTIAPLRLKNSTGCPVNPIAVF